MGEEPVDVEFVPSSGTSAAPLDFSWIPFHRHDHRANIAVNSQISATENLEAKSDGNSMDLLVLAKCGLLQQLIGAYFAGPYWQLLIAAFLFSLAQVSGLLWDSRRRHLLPSRPQLLFWLRAVVLVALTFCIACIAIGGIQYLFFVLRISKDTVFCSYFEASRNLDRRQVITLLALFLANLFLASRFALAGFPRNPPPQDQGFGELVAIKVFSIIAIAVAYVICLWPDVGQMRLAYILLILGAVLAMNMLAVRRRASKHY